MFEENPTGGSEQTGTIETLMTNHHLAEDFIMREAAHERTAAGLAIAGDTTFYARKELKVMDNPAIELDGHTGALNPESLECETFHISRPHEKSVGMVEIFKNYFSRGQFRKLPSLERADFVKDGWNEDTLVALLYRLSNTSFSFFIVQPRK